MEINNEKVICPICNEKFKQITKGHIQNIHNINFDKFKKDYPNLKLKTDSLSKKMSESNRKSANILWEQRREDSKKMEEYKSKVSGRNNSMNRSYKARKMASVRMLQMREDPNFIEKMKKGLTSPEAIEKRYISFKKNMSKNCINTSIERIVKKQLIDNNIEFEQQYVVRKEKGYQLPDFYIPGLNLIIECNGDYWHMNPNKYKPYDYNETIKSTAEEIWEKDNSKIELYKSKGYNVLVLWEHDIKMSDFSLLTHI